ncbi:MAG TPA: thioredoxin family protein [Longimicrobiales bacterium]|nr:thioredoxin family protein [Longimicrobiales bacterium]
MLKGYWDAAMTLEQFIAEAKQNQELWQQYYRRATVPDEIVERLRDLPGPRYLLVIAEDWCGDAFNTVPYVARLAEAVPQFELRVVRRDENPELMDRYLTGTSRAIPVVIVMDEEFRELGWWGSRPKELQTWFLSDEAQAMPKEDRYREMRRWYARDRGRSALSEIAELLEKTAVGV